MMYTFYMYRGWVFSLSFFISDLYEGKDSEFLIANGEP